MIATTSHLTEPLFYTGSPQPLRRIKTFKISGRKAKPLLLEKIFKNSTNFLEAAGCEDNAGISPLKLHLKQNPLVPLSLAGYFMFKKDQLCSHHSLAFWNIFNQGEAGRFCQPSGNQGHCQGRDTLSGCGIIARCRPSREQRAAVPKGEPLGLNG